ncbi:hypothetical protein MKX01_023342 [Papaver californicum]|nr:hypothetical protein MKX01_023342 [Papaver californicum]
MVTTAAATTPVSYMITSSTASNSSSSSRSHNHTPSFKLPTFLTIIITRTSTFINLQCGIFSSSIPSDPSFVVFKASSKDTPALRAGNVQPYNFIIPPSWRQTRVANILSGNYCQPKSAEPWVEVKFENEKQGKIQVVASPLIRLTNKLTATIEEIGTPEKLIASLGLFVTGNTLDSDEIVETSIEKQGDQTYNKYVMETPFALTGTHNLAKATAKGNTVILFVVSASDKQWQASQKTLKAILYSFEV